MKLILRCSCVLCQVRQTLFLELQLSSLQRSGSKSWELAAGLGRVAFEGVKAAVRLHEDAWATLRSTRSLPLCAIPPSPHLPSTSLSTGSSWTHPSPSQEDKWQEGRSLFSLLCFLHEGHAGRHTAESPTSQAFLLAVTSPSHFAFKGWEWCLLHSPPVPAASQCCTPKHKWMKPKEQANIC